MTLSVSMVKVHDRHRRIHCAPQESCQCQNPSICHSGIQPICGETLVNRWADAIKKCAHSS